MEVFHDDGWREEWKVCKFGSNSGVGHSQDTKDDSINT